jgi:hypothetical protein
MRLWERSLSPMSMRSLIARELQQVAVEHGRTLAPLMDEIRLLESLQIYGIVALVASAARREPLNPVVEVRQVFARTRPVCHPFQPQSSKILQYPLIDELRHKAGVSLLNSRTISLYSGRHTGISVAFVRGFDGKIVVWFRKRRRAILTISR